MTESVKKMWQTCVADSLIVFDYNNQIIMKMMSYMPCTVIESDKVLALCENGCTIL